MLNSQFLTFTQCPTVEKVLPHMLAVDQTQRAGPEQALALLNGNVMISFCRVTQV